MEQARQAASGSGQLSMADAAGSDESLRQRLEAAILSMQEGLVERDVEVSTSKLVAEPLFDRQTALMTLSASYQKSQLATTVLCKSAVFIIVKL